MDCCASAIVEAPTLAALFGIGLTIGFGHCAGMCGPLMALVAAVQREGAGGWGGLAARQLAYHGGRISIYAIAGAALGLVHASVARADAYGTWFAGGLSLATGGVTLLVALGMLGLVRVPDFPKLEGVASRILGSDRGGGVRGMAAAGPSRQFALGAANGMLPCGPVVATALAAGATATPGGGALGMTAYGVGTLPVALLVAFGAVRLSPSARRRFVHAGILLLVVVGGQLVVRGLSAFGWISHAHIGEFVLW